MKPPSPQHPSSQLGQTVAEPNIPLHPWRLHSHTFSQANSLDYVETDMTL